MAAWEGWVKAERVIGVKKLVELLKLAMYPSTVLHSSQVLRSFE